MGHIADEAAARRLARAIGSDIALYHDDKLRSGQPLDDEIAEGRELFRARVEPHLHRVYEAEIENLLGPRPNAPLEDYRGTPRPQAPDPELEPSPWPGRVLVITLVLLVLAAMVLMYVRR